MINNEKVGQRIALLRKGKGITQEKLAELMGVTGQAISKWEKGNALPDISLLPALSRTLGTSIDLLLTPYDLFVLDAKYGANGAFTDVTVRLNAQVGDCGLCLCVDNAALGADPAPGIYKYLIARYIAPDGVFYTCAGEGTALQIPPRGQALSPVFDDGLEILSAHYGSEWISNDVTARLRSHLHARSFDGVPVNHEWFASPPAVDEDEYLSVLYRSRDGFFVLAVPEGGSIAISKDRRFLMEAQDQVVPARSRRIWGVEKLQWGKGQDCTYAGALTATLRVMGEEVDYTTVMGVSGACWRLAFCTSCWDYSSVDGMVVFDHATPAWNAIGYEIKGYDRVEKKEREQVRGEIVDSINRGVPVLAIDLRVVPEWGVIAGYSESGKVLWCRTYFDEGVEEYLPAEKWPFILFFFGKKGTPLPDRDRLLRSLAIFVEEMNIPQRRGYAMGYRAYETWSSGLLDQDGLDGLDGPGFRERMCVNHFCYTALVDARQSAAAYLHASQGLLEGEAVPHLDAAAALYCRVAEKLAQGWQWIPGEAQCQEGEDPRLVWTEEKRRCQAGLLQEVMALEKQVEQEFRAILAL